MTTTQLIKVSDDVTLRHDLAVAMVKIFHPGYQGGSYYVDLDTLKIYYKESQALWNPWGDAGVVPIEQLFDTENNDFDPSPDWNEFDEKPQLIRDWLDATGEDLEDNGDIPEWALEKKMWSDIMDWGLSHSEWKVRLIQYEQDQEQIAIEFAMSEIKDEIEIK